MPLRCRSCAARPTESGTAREHAAAFFRLKEQATNQSDLAARREMMRLFYEELAPRIFAGARYDAAYHAALDAAAKERGCDSIIAAWISTPGH